jgi:hypothetical protein
VEAGNWKLETDPSWPLEAGKWKLIYVPHS